MPMIAGSFSRTAVNFSAGCETVVSNIVMAVTVLISLELLTKLMYYTPLAILASIILSALPGLINLHAAYHIWKVDKMDFLVCTGAFFGVLFGSVEIGLLVAVITLSHFALNYKTCSHKSWPCMHNIVLHNYAAAGWHFIS